MVNWSKYPFIRLLIPFAIGIWLAFSFPFLIEGNVERVILILSTIGAIVLAVIHSVVRDYQFRWVFGVILNLQLLFLGFAIVHIRDDDLNPDKEVFVARLTECPTVKDKSVKIVLEMLSDHGSVMAYFEKDTRALSLNYGDVISFFERPKLVEPPKNPEQFDYCKYLGRKGILRQVYLKSDAWTQMNYEIANPIYKFSYRLRNFLMNTMQNLGIEGDEFAVAVAILLGYDDTLPEDLREKYVTAGSMHILCVSGMHVGVIFMVFSYMLSFLDNRKIWQNLLKQSLLLLLIWFYALLAGLAPSILRATIMLSFVILGDMTGRKGVLLNSMAASALLLLCLNPANLFNIGFLLSYVAVIGIVELQKPICNLFFFRFKILDKIWEMTAVTLAAQLATAPFSIYYFHQFPMYFWLSNLFMGPLSTVVIAGGMLMLLVFFVSHLNIAVAWCVKWMIYLMNYIVTSIESLPMSMIKGLYINELEFICLLLSLLMLLVLMSHKRKSILYGLLFLMFVFSTSQLSRAINQREQMSMTIYSINKATALDLVCGNTHLMLVDSTIIRDPSVIEFSVENNLIKEGVFSNGMLCPIDTAAFENAFMKKQNNLMSFGGKTIGVYDKKSLSRKHLPHKMYFDYYLLCGADYIDLETVMWNYDIGKLIIDNSVSEHMSRKIIQKAEDMGVDYYDVRTRGAFILYSK